MNCNDIVARFENRILTILDKQKLPLYLLNTENVEHWLETRAIDCHRANSRLLKKALRLTEKDDISTVISVNAVTVTDTYWIKAIDSPLTYEEVRFDNDYFSNLALYGTYDSFNNASNSLSLKTPELTNIGSFEKCWKLKNGEWWLYKKAEHKEQFSELFAYEFGKALGMNMAEYSLGDRCVKTKDFTNNAEVNFEPAYSFMGDNEDYIETINKLSELSDKLAADYVKMIFLDTLLANPDRHTFNFGILRAPHTGEVIGFAPNFDNNMALISRGYPKNTERKNDLLIRLFNELIEYDCSFKKLLPIVNEDIILEVIKKINMKVQTNLIVDFIMTGYRKII